MPEQTPSTYDAIGPKVAIRRPTMLDQEEFLKLVQVSQEFLRPWLEPPDTPQRFAAYIRCRPSATDDAFLICNRTTHQILGVINLNCIVRGHFQSAYLGYWIGQPHAHQGYMTEAMNLTTKYAFTNLALHRIEANIQPENHPSIALVRKCGFRKEGFSPKYLEVAGQWRDHERWALRAD